MNIPFRNLLKVLPLMAASFSIHAADLTDQTGPVLSDTSATSRQSVSVNQSSNAELLFQIQQMQREMQELRNLVEQQRRLMLQLQKDGRDRYLDADRRLSAISQDVEQLRTQKSSVTDSGTKPGKTDKSALPVVSGSAKEAYQQAYALVKQQKFDPAISAYQSFIKTYPESSLLPNAYYWLGELYMVKNLTQEAERAFKMVIADFPDSRKVPDANYKLGLVYSRYGQEDKAVKQMQSVQQTFPESTAAKLAKQFLSTRNN